MSDKIELCEVPEHELKFGKLWDLVIEIAKRTKSVPLNARPGVWYVKVDEHWEFAMNGHGDPVRSPELAAEVPAYHLYAKFNGWPFAVISPHGGSLGNGAVANIDAFAQALQNYLERISCQHDHLNMDGICHRCGKDCRGIG